ncbi:leucine-rich repeat-containing protein 15-like [Agrilus planipennis]|uniref:Leucine-rich repeat-containing protein 15-like n=1 Tax=Agrilus planipennis TaxID=224129 RepID=A0A1W4WJZ7_AGRPL|nr:leucine-rich repeat-containing protein 15-like [Agrilus planipennis]XP_025829867.1 leucine-rich repeat-containing protein 15-like [Agrilus planipennis]
MTKLHVTYLILFLPWLWVVSAICPNQCSCYLDHRGRTTVSCSQGGMTGSIPVLNFKNDTEVIIITAPENNMNLLTMGPVFDEFKNLEELHITRSNIPEMGKYFFYSLRKLDVLNLSQNNITQPLDYNFVGLNNLNKLILDDNRIESLASETFRHLQKLTVLSIRRNRIQKLMPRVFYHLSKLKVLKLSGNRMRYLNAIVFKDIQQLQELECRGCALLSINAEVFQHLQQLVSLDFGSNEIERIFANDFMHLTNLKKLKLDGNRLSAVSNGDFVYLTNLEKLNLARNANSKIEPNAFERLSELRVLDIGYNRLDELDSNMLRDLSDQLETLVLSGNGLSIFFVITLRNSTVLKELHLADMGITDIPPAVLPPNLEELDLSGNYLFYFQPGAIPSNLSVLDISRNRFRGLNEDVLVQISQVPVLKLKDNPWLCDMCHIIPLLQRVNISEDIRNVQCFGPRSHEGRILGTILQNELEWCSAPGYTTSDTSGYFLQDTRIGIIAATASVLLLILTGTAIIVALCYSKRHAAKYYTHEEKRAAESESIFDNQMSFLGDDKEISFKFPVDYGEKKVAIATIDDEIKKDKMITNGL